MRRFGSFLDFLDAAGSTGAGASTSFLGVFVSGALAGGVVALAAGVFGFSSFLAGAGDLEFSAFGAGLVGAGLVALAGAFGAGVFAFGAGAFAFGAGVFAFTGFAGAAGLTGFFAGLDFGAGFEDMLDK